MKEGKGMRSWHHVPTRQVNYGSFIMLYGYFLSCDLTFLLSTALHESTILKHNSTGEYLAKSVVIYHSIQWSSLTRYYKMV